MYCLGEEKWIYQSMKPWTGQFIQNSQALLFEIEKERNLKPIGNLEFTVSRMPNISPDYLLHTLVSILNSHQHHKHYLTDKQIGVIYTLLRYGLMSSVDDFEYIVTHLPFSSQLLQMIMDQTNLPVYLSTPFMSPVIYRWIFSHVKWCSVCQIGRIKVYFYHDTDCDLTVQMEEICIIDQIVRYCYKVTDSQQLQIHYVMSPYRKYLQFYTPREHIDRYLIPLLKNMDNNDNYNYRQFWNPLSPLHVNSGVTVKAHNYKFITIWRQQEFTKVLIHELIHYYNLEKSCNIMLPEVNISDNYPRIPKELLTELQTWYMYILYIDRPHNDQTLVGMLNKQRYHALIVVYRILRHYNMTNIGQLFDQRKPNDYTINVNSSTMYYYVYKALVLFEGGRQLENLLIPLQPVPTSININPKLGMQILDKLLSTHNTPCMSSHIPMMWTGS